MKTSENTNTISEALAKCQKVLRNPEKDCTATIPMKSGGKYSYKYASLPSIYDGCREALAANGLSHFAALIKQGDKDFLEMRLSHSSGQWIESQYELPIMNDPKQRAAEITYGRRYLFTALIGIAADEDTDGDLTDRKKKSEVPSNIPSNLSQKNVVDTDKPSLAQLAVLQKIIKEAFWTKDDALKYLKEKFHVNSTKELHWKQWETACAYIEQHPMPENATVQEVEPKVDSFAAFQEIPISNTPPPPPGLKNREAIMKAILAEADKKKIDLDELAKLCKNEFKMLPEKLNNIQASQFLDLIRAQEIRN